MLGFVGLLEEEIASVQHLLESIPFTNIAPLDHFLEIYKLSHQEVLTLKEQPLKFPIESNKMLKLGISLGNLIKTLQLDEEMYLQQREQQQNFINNLNKSRSSIAGSSSNNNSTTGVDDPFVKRLHVISSSNSTQPIHHMKFVKNLLIVLKNFDIGNKQESNGNSYHSQGTGSTNTSPIKLNSKQLLIEKLEINIKLDVIFIYNTLFKLIDRILNILKTSLLDVTSISDMEESSSIFSINSVNSDSSIPLDEYLKFLKQCIHRISLGIILPFYNFVFTELVETNIQSDFSSLANSL